MYTNRNQSVYIFIFFCYIKIVGGYYMRILAMGGGENGRPGKPYEIKKFDEEIVKMTGKQNGFGLTKKKRARMPGSVSTKH